MRQTEQKASFPPLFLFFQEVNNRPVSHLPSRQKFDPLYSFRPACQIKKLTSFHSKHPSWHWLILIFISFRIFPISRFEIPNSSAILKDTGQGSFPFCAFAKIVSSSFLRSILIPPFSIGFVPLFPRESLISPFVVRQAHHERTTLQ